MGKTINLDANFAPIAIRLAQSPKAIKDPQILNTNPD